MVKLHDRRRFPAVEGDVGVSEVVDDDDAVLARERDHLLEEVELDTLGGGIGRKPEDHHLGLGDELADRALGLGEEVHARRHAHRADVGAGDDRPVDVDRVARIGNQHRVAAVERGEHEVREAFLGADRDDRLAVHVEIDVPAALVPLGDGAAQPRDAFRNGVTVRILALGDLDQLVHDMARRGSVGIAHREVDDVLARAASRHLQLVGDVEDVRRQALDALELEGDGYDGVLEVHGGAMLQCKIRILQAGNHR